MDNEKNIKDEFKKADIESINLWHHREIRTATYFCDIVLVETTVLGGIR